MKTEYIKLTYQGKTARIVDVADRALLESYRDEMIATGLKESDFQIKPIN